MRISYANATYEEVEWLGYTFDIAFDCDKQEIVAEPRVAILG